MKTIFFVLLAGLGTFLIYTPVHTPDSLKLNPTEDEIVSLVERSYINGAFNGLDPDAMEEGFHEEFAIFSADGNKLGKYPIDRWVESVRKRKESEDFDPASNRWDHKFASVDVTGNSAAVKVELFRDGNQVYTDYLSLLKFRDGWKIVAKVYHQHN